MPRADEALLFLRRPRPIAPEEIIKPSINMNKMAQFFLKCAALEATELRKSCWVPQIRVELLQLQQSVAFQTRARRTTRDQRITITYEYILLWREGPGSTISLGVLPTTQKNHTTFAHQASRRVACLSACCPSDSGAMQDAPGPSTILVSTLANGPTPSRYYGEQAQGGKLRPP